MKHSSKHNPKDKHHSTGETHNDHPIDHNDSASESDESPKKEARDMSHVESMIDSMDEDEQAHAHEHLKKKMEPSLNNPDDELGAGTKYDDFMAAKANQD